MGWAHQAQPNDESDMRLTVLLTRRHLMIRKQHLLVYLDKLVQQILVENPFKNLIFVKFILPKFKMMMELLVVVDVTIVVRNLREEGMVHSTCT